MRQPSNGILASSACAIGLWLGACGAEGSAGPAAAAPVAQAADRSADAPDQGPPAPAVPATAGGGEASPPPEAQADEPTPPAPPALGLDELAELELGLAICDEYVRGAVACLRAAGSDHARAAALHAALAEQAAAWKQTIDGGGSPKAVEIGCRTAREDLAAARLELGCR